MVFLIFIEFIYGVTLVNKIMQVSGAQFHNTSPVPVLCVHCPKSGLCLSAFIPIHPPPHPPLLD